MSYNDNNNVHAVYLGSLAGTVMLTWVFLHLHWTYIIYYYTTWLKQLLPLTLYLTRTETKEEADIYTYTY